MNLRFPILAVLLFTFVSIPAFAGEMWVSDDEEMAIEYWGFLKNQALGMHFRGIGLYPDDLAGQDTTKIRAGLKFGSEVFRAGLDYEFRFTFRSDGMEGGASGLGSWFDTFGWRVVEDQDLLAGDLALLVAGRRRERAVTACGGQVAARSPCRSPR